MQGAGKGECARPRDGPQFAHRTSTKVGEEHHHHTWRGNAIDQSLDRSLLPYSGDTSLSQEYMQYCSLSAHRTPGMEV